MLASTVALLACAGLAFAAPPAQATYCYEDNLLRAFQHTPTPARKYCATPTHYPTFLAATSYPATRLNSACSCFSRFPTEAPTCSPAAFAFSSTGETGMHISILVTVGPAGNCRPCRVKIVCGTFGGQTVAFDPTDYFYGSDDCYDVGTGPNYNGLNFRTPGKVWDIFNLEGVYHISDDADSDGPAYPGTWQSAAYSAPCPT